MKKTIVFLPGLMNSKKVWNSVLDKMPSHINGLAINLPAQQTTRDIVNDIKEQLPDEFYLCGFSFGGYIALELLEQMPERILGLIMIGSTCRGDTEKQKLGRQKIVEGIERGNYEKMIETNKEWLFGEDFSSENKMKLYEDMANSYGAHTYIAHLQATMSREDKTNLLIEHPHLRKLIIAGESDKIIPSHILEKHYKDIVNQEIKIVTDTGHMIPLENAQELVNVIVTWLNEEDFD